LAQTYWRRGDQQRSRAYADTASEAYGALLRDVFNPVDRALTIALQALALAYSGREQDAFRRGSEALSAAMLAATPPRRLSYIRYLVVRIHLLGGDTEKALDQLEQANYPAGWLKVDPTFAPLRGSPRFERLANANP
jgi:hypothetical protein